MRRTPSASLRFEQVLWKLGFLRVAGVDEAGRGCLAGPVVAAAVIWKDGLPDEGIRDSKKLNADKRSVLLDHIREQAVAWSVGLCTPEEIDRINILNAALLAMSRALDQLETPADYCLVDGNRLPPALSAPSRAIVRGDLRSRSIAAASIVAKVTRDRLMEDLHEQHPEYGWLRNKGYPTNDHIEALSSLGPTVFHRKTFHVRRLGA